MLNLVYIFVVYGSGGRIEPTATRLTVGALPLSYAGIPCLRGVLVAASCNDKMLENKVGFAKHRSFWKTEINPREGKRGVR